MRTARNRGGMKVRAKDYDPVPGIGGYDYPRGPYGATGFDGSTSAVRENPPQTEGRLHDDYAGHDPERDWHPIEIQQDNVIPTSQVTHGPDNARNPDRVRDTEERPHIVLSADVPGGERQRNTVYYGGIQARPTPDKRYVYGGTNGGTDVLSGIIDGRHMPYTGARGTMQAVEPTHGLRNIRGGWLNGERYFQRPGSELGLNQGGAYGERIRGQKRHRPTIFKEPSPWTGRFYDTTANVGGPDTPGTNTHIAESVHVSTKAAPRRNRRF